MPSPISITFFNEDIDFQLKNKAKLKTWIQQAVLSELPECKRSKISYIFCSDEFLLKMNQQYLQHDYFTDVITFDYSETETVSGDIFISIDRIGENAATFGKSVEDELHRVMIHGVLHLLGYEDASDTQRAEMQTKEDEKLKLRG